MRDRGTAATRPPHGVERRGNEPEGIEARVLPVGFVFDGGRGVQNNAGDIGELHLGTAIGAEGGELDLSGAVIDRGVLIQDDRVEVLRVREVSDHRAVDGDRAPVGDGGNQQTGAEEGNREEGEEAPKEPFAGAAVSLG